jgi:hypothetical protein
MRATTATRVLRGALGLLYLAGAGFHVAVTLRDPVGVYEAFLDMTWLGFYERVINDLVLPQATAFTLGLIAFEVLAGLLILSRDRSARWGHGAAAVFNMLLVPTLSWPYWLANLLLIALHAVCFRTRFQEPRTPRPPAPARRPLTGARAGG